MKNNLTDIKDSITTLAKLYLKRTKLTLVEVLTLFCGGIALVSIVLICIIIFLMFISFGVAQELCNVMTPGLAYFVVGAFWLLVVVVLFLLRKILIYNPVVRFISRLILEENDTHTKETEGEERDE